MPIMEGSERASGLCSGKNSELKVFYQGEKEEDVTLSVFFTVFILVPFSIDVLRELLFMFTPW